MTAPVVTVTLQKSGGSPHLYIYPTVVDDVAVTRVEIVINGVIYRSYADPPYDTYFRMERGTYTVIVRAYDAAGNLGVSAPQSASRE